LCNDRRYSTKSDKKEELSGSSIDAETSGAHSNFEANPVPATDLLSGV